MLRWLPWGLAIAEQQLILTLDSNRGLILSSHDMAEAWLIRCDKTSHELAAGFRLLRDRGSNHVGRTGRRRYLILAKHSFSRSSSV